MTGLKLHSFRFSAMGTRCLLHVYALSREEAEHSFAGAAAEVERIEARYSRYRHESDLSIINRVAEAGGVIEVDAETAGLLDYAFAAHKRSAGLFDITSGLLRRAWDFRSGRLPEQAALDRLLPRVGLEKLRWDAPFLRFTRPGMELDFGGLCKEYAADRAAAACRDRGALHGLVELGGDIRVIGPHPDGRPWSIGIRHPRSAESLSTTASLGEGGLATSGEYERCIEIGGRRYGHILHPATGWPVSGLASVSVIADECLLAGAVCTIAMLMGESGKVWLRDLSVPHMWIDEQAAAGRWRWPSREHELQEREALAAAVSRCISLPV